MIKVLEQPGIFGVFVELIQITIEAEPLQLTYNVSDKNNPSVRCTGLMGKEKSHWSSILQIRAMTARSVRRNATSAPCIDMVTCEERLDFLIGSL